MNNWKTDKGSLESLVPPFSYAELMDSKLTYGCQGETWKDERIDFGTNFIPENPDSLGGHESVERACEKVGQNHHDNKYILIMDEDADTATHQQRWVKDRHDCFKG